MTVDESGEVIISGVGQRVTLKSKLNEKHKILQQNYEKKHEVQATIQDNDQRILMC